jgi:transposase
MTENKQKKCLTKEQVLQIPELVKQKTYKEIALLFDTTEGTIKNWVAKLRKSGYQVKAKRGRRALLD